MNSMSSPEKNYHKNLVKLCGILAAINVDGELFNKLAPPKLRRMGDNQKIRWILEDQIRVLLRKNGDFPQ